MKVILTDAAWEDLFQIGSWIKTDNPRRASSFIDELEQRCLALGDTPRAFPLLSGHAESGIRRRPYRNYLIFYRVETDQVTILRILNAAQDSEVALFGETDPGA